MANLCENYLTISGPEKEIYAIKGGMFCPSLSDYSGNADYEYGYYANIDFNSIMPNQVLTGWGTSGNARDTYIISAPGDKTSIELTFETPWSPPDAVIKALIRRYPSCRFAFFYYESGYGFAGNIVSQNDGNFTHQHYEDAYQSDEIINIAVEYFGYEDEFRENGIIA